jgi:hypothetical protein
MNLGFYILLAFLVVAQIVLDYLVKFVVRDGRTLIHKISRRTLACVTLAVLLFGLFKEEQKDRKAQAKDREAAEYATNLVVEVGRVHSEDSNLLMQVQSLTATNGEMRSQICDLTKAIGDLLLANASKPEIDLGTRSEMLAIKKKLDVGDVCTSDLAALVSVWSNKLAQAKIDREREHLKTIEQQKQLLAPSLDVWDYAIRRFQAKLAGYLGSSHRKVVSDYAGVPALESLCPGSTGDNRWPGIDTNVCEITIGTGSNWTCNCWIERDTCSGWCDSNPTRLKLESRWSGGSETLTVTVQNGVVSYSVPARDGGTGDSRALSEYQKTIEAATDDFLAAQADVIQGSQ